MIRPGESKLAPATLQRMLRWQTHYDRYERLRSTDAMERSRSEFLASNPRANNYEEALVISSPNGIWLRNAFDIDHLVRNTNERTVDTPAQRSVIDRDANATMLATNTPPYLNGYH